MADPMLDWRTHLVASSPLLQGRWEDRNPLNTPGLFYCGASDTCFTGPLAAPNNVCVDGEGQEVVFRQPVSDWELRQVLDAADQDPFAGYAADGAEKWTVPLVRLWWRNRGDVLVILTTSARAIDRDDGGDRHLGAAYYRWVRFLRDDARGYLREFLYFLEVGSIPATGVLLPDLEE